MFLNKSNLLSAVIGGWQASGTFVLSSGFPFTPTVDGNNSFSQAGDWYPNQIGNPKPSHRSIDNWFDPTAYALPSPGPFGNMRRNSLVSPGIDEVNLSAGKSFALGDRLNLQILYDAHQRLQPSELWPAEHEPRAKWGYGREFVRWIINGNSFAYGGWPNDAAERAHIVLEQLRYRRTIGMGTTRTAWHGGRALNLQ